MPWPLSQEYNEAVQNPATNFTDPDLKKGEAVANALGIPMPCSGNFADVYQVRCPDGSRWAVKCFTRESLGLRERYQKISGWLRRANLPFTVDFRYVKQGIRVGTNWYPILKMRWVDGLTLNQFVAQHLDKPAILEALSQLWAKMGKSLRAAQVGHCDLQHGNVLLAPGSTPNALALKLIDYDGMWIPPLTMVKSGEVGHPSYQHPQRLREGTYNLDVDRFPLLVVAAALRCLQVGGRRLWDRYDNGDNLLFKAADFLSPHESPLFAELLTLNDPEARSVTAQLMAAAQKRLEQTPLLEEVFPDKSGDPAGQPLEDAAVTFRAVPIQSALVASPSPSALSYPLAVAAPAWLPDVLQAQRPEPPLVRWQLPPTPRTTSKTAKASAWVWGAGAAVLVFLLGGMVGRFYLLPGNNSTVPLAGSGVLQNRSSDKSSHGTIQEAPAVGQKEVQVRQNTPKEPSFPRDVTNSVGMRLVPIPAGKFVMGSPFNEAGRNLDEGPQHEVVIGKPFYMASCPVTKGQFAVFVQALAYKTEVERNGKGGSGYDAATRQFVNSSPKFSWRNTGFVQTERDPVVNVTWNDAEWFCAWLSRKEGVTYQLPSEAEWEYACRAGTTTAYFFGDDPRELGDYAWYRHNSGLHSHPVAEKKPNPWGLYDMNGSVRQWCSDFYRTYMKTVLRRPKGNNIRQNRVLRGGSGFIEPKECRSAYRFNSAPQGTWADIGFRIVLRIP